MEVAKNKNKPCLNNVEWFDLIAFCMGVFTVIFLMTKIGIIIVYGPSDTDIK